MNDLEINKALAIAIGWKPEQIIEYEGQDYIGLPVMFNRPAIKLFDYRWPVVIWPIAERYGCFPSDIVSGNFRKHKRQGYPDVVSWEVFTIDYKRSTLQEAQWEHYTADTAAKAVALAVIGVSK